MNMEEMEVIINELSKMDSKIQDMSFEEQYSMAFDFYHIFDKQPEDWVLQEFIDVASREHKWFWRRKS